MVETMVPRASRPTPRAIGSFPARRGAVKRENAPGILVVDDNLGLSDVWQLALGDAGYRVGVAGSGAQAIAAVSSQPYDLALLDVHLPDMLGIRLLEELRRSHPEMECVIVTAHSSAESAVAALEQGAYGYLIKPVPISALLVTVERVLAQQRLRDENRRMLERERRIAETLQQSFLPEIANVAAGLDAGTLYRAALDEARIGGDFYDLFPLGESRTGIVIGDVSGKGLAAAVQTAMVRYAIRLCAFEDPSPVSVVMRASRFLFAQMDAECFATLFYGLLDTARGILRYVSAGHEPALLWRPGTREILSLKEGGTVLGALPDPSYREGAVDLPPGSILLLYTDGVTEARHGEELLEEDGLRYYLRRRLPAAATVQELVIALHEDVVHFAGGKPHDDIALMALRVSDSPTA